MSDTNYGSTVRSHTVGKHVTKLIQSLPTSTPTRAAAPLTVVAHLNTQNTQNAAFFTLQTLFVMHPLDFTDNHKDV